MLMVPLVLIMPMVRVMLMVLTVLTRVVGQTDMMCWMLLCRCADSVPPPMPAL